MTITISTNQAATLQAFINSGNYAAGYLEVKEIVDQARASTTDTSQQVQLEILSNWLTNAASINSDDGSVKSEFVREATSSIATQVGNPISAVDFQNASDNLAL